MNHADGICSLDDVFVIERELDIGTSVCRCLSNIGHKTPENLSRLGFSSCDEGEAENDFISIKQNHETLSDISSA